MRSAGFVLVGGASTRMKQDKALLPFAGGTLAEHIAGVVAEASGSATLIGDPQRHGGMGYPVVPDLRPGLGPLSGVETALSLKHAEWNLIVACDLPQVSADVFAKLLRFAELSGAACVFPLTGGHPQPLAGVWHTRSLASVRLALDRDTRKVTEAVDPADVLFWPVPDADVFRNVNTPEEWDAFLES